MSEATRLLSLRLQRSSYPNETVEKYIIYKGDKHDLTDDEYQKIIELLPEFWNTEKDKLTYFCLFPDKTFLCNRSKEVYNYAIKDTEIKTYNFDAATESQVNNLVSIVTDFFTKIKTEKLNTIFDTVLDRLADLSYMKEAIIDFRNKALQQCDYMFATDYKFKSENDKELWTTYRQEWRDITDQESWKNSDFFNVKIPVAPQPREQFNLFEDGLNKYFVELQFPQEFGEILREKFDSQEKSTYSQLIENYGGIILKLDILQKLSSLQLPLGFDVDELISILYDPLKQPSFYGCADDEEKCVSEYEQFFQSLQNKVSLLDEKFKQYDLGFTFGDIMIAQMEQTKKRILEKELEEKALDMLREMQFGEES